MDVTDVDLRLWSTATFRTVTFTVAVAMGFHLRGTLRESLAQLNTIVGVAFFAILWTATLFASEKGFRYHERHGRTAPYSPSHLEATTVAGACNGLCLYAILAVAAVLLLHTPQAVAAIAVFSVVGAAVAAAIGTFFGIAYGAIEVLLLRVSHALVKTGEEDASIVTT
jgi:hypothetical protein